MSSGTFYDEMHGLGKGTLPHYQHYASWLTGMPDERIVQKRTEAEVMFHRVGVTFAVYGQSGGGERLIPFDIIPRIIPVDEWAMLDSGIKQRVRALNMFRGCPDHS